MSIGSNTNLQTFTSKVIRPTQVWPNATRCCSFTSRFWWISRIRWTANNSNQHQTLHAVIYYYRKLHMSNNTLEKTEQMQMMWTAIDFQIVDILSCTYTWDMQQWKAVMIALMQTCVVEAHSLSHQWTSPTLSSHMASSVWHKHWTTISNDYIRLTVPAVTSWMLRSSAPSWLL